MPIRLQYEADNNYKTINLIIVMDYFSKFKSAGTSFFPDETGQQTKLYDLEPYTAFTEDLEFMYRWTIYRDQKLVQEGCSLTFDASKRAVEHVLAFFSVSTSSRCFGE